MMCFASNETFTFISTIFPGTLGDFSSFNGIEFLLLTSDMGYHKMNFIACLIKEGSDNVEIV